MYEWVLCVFGSASESGDIEVLYRFLDSRLRGSNDPCGDSGRLVLISK